MSETAIGAAAHEESQETERYDAAIRGEGEFWDNFIAQRVLRGEIPGSLDWRLNFTQFRYNHDWRPLCLGPALINFRARELQYVITEATRRPGMRVLDLGCGSGWLSLELARRGAHVTGLDISRSNLALARYMAETNTRNFPFLYQNFLGLPCRLEEFGGVEYEYADLNQVTLPADEYDAVVVWDSLHHVAELERLLEEVKRSLRPGGIFLGLDHTFASQRTEEFNLLVLRWLDDFYAWVTEQDPKWLYELVGTTARTRDWGVLAVDYDATPVPNFGPFKDQLLGELLEILRSHVGRETIEKGSQGGSATAQTDSDEESPFEDVSAHSVVNALLQKFQVRRFSTVGPFIMPEKHIPMYRTEEERIFQSYLAAGLVEMGERAIARDQADGQWFLFDLTVEGGMGQVANAPEIIQANESQLFIARREEYIAYLEGEIARKDAALVELEGRVRTREAELVEARKPRLPWKRLRGER